MVLINDHWSVNETSEVVLKIFKVEFEYDSASVIWWSELKIYGEQGQIKELSLKIKDECKSSFPMMRNLKEECKTLYSAIKFK